MKKKGKPGENSVRRLPLKKTPESGLVSVLSSEIV